MVPDAVSDVEMILHTMICCRGIMRWDGIRRLIVEGHTFPRMDVAELLEYVVLPYRKDIPKPRGLNINITQGLTLNQDTWGISSYAWLLKEEVMHKMQWSLSMIGKKSLMSIVWQQNKTSNSEICLHKGN